MKQIHVDLGERSYPISIGVGLLNDPNAFPQLKAKQKVVVISNVTVAPLYAEQLIKTLDKIGCVTDRLVLPDGEQYKTLESFNTIMSFLIESNYGRDVVLVALGGGVIGDLVGFAAASYQRGVDFIQVPTTLLSQVDSSVGGKTAVNHPLGKNMIGAFYQPKSVIIDTECLRTLPAREFSAGMSEVIKYGVIIDSEFFGWLEAKIEPLFALNSDALEYAIARCCQIKADVVNADEKEQGVRALLNLGHTYGHAIEAELGYGNWLHGEAVSSGTMMAAHTSRLQNLMTTDQVERIQTLLEQSKLPVHTPESMSYDDFFKHMMRDKKVLAGQLRLILPTGIGSAEVIATTPENIIKLAIDACRV